jgi:hypothetical protein
VLHFFWKALPGGLVRLMRSFSYARLYRKLGRRGKIRGFRSISSRGKRDTPMRDFQWLPMVRLHIVVLGMKSPDVPRLHGENHGDVGKLIDKATAMPYSNCSQMRDHELLTHPPITLQESAFQRHMQLSTRRQRYIIGQAW